VSEPFECTPLEGGRGSSLPVRAQPGARRPGLVGVHGGQLKVALSSPPERGRATGELLEILAAALGLRPRSLELVSGARSRDKLVHVPLPPEQVRARLAPRL